MAKLEIKENKTLKLTQVFCKELPALPYDDLEHEMTKFSNFIQVNNIQTRGPLVIHNKGMRITDVGEFVSDCRLMMQLQEAISSFGEYTYIPEVVVKECLYLHYEDEDMYLSMATSKLTLHMYENDYVDAGGTYQVLINNSGGKVIIDYFQPVEEA